MIKTHIAHNFSKVLLITLCASMTIVSMLQNCLLPLRLSWKNIHLHDSATWRGSYLTGLVVCVLSIGRQTLILLNIIMWHKCPCKGAHDGSHSRILHSDAFKSKWVLSFFKYLNLKVCNCNKLLLSGIQTGTCLINLCKHIYF